MASLRLKSYIPLVKFLSATLGPDYEIALHSYSSKGSSLIALENGHISGRELGAPLNAHSLEAVSSGAYKTSDYMNDYTTRSLHGKMLRSCTFFIKDDHEDLIGLLSINFDDGRYQNLIHDILKLCHSDNFVEQKYIYRDQQPNPQPTEQEHESLHSSVKDAVDDVLEKLILSRGLPVERLTLEEKLELVAHMYDKGIFILKGSVKEVALKLNCSQTSIYRYVKNLKKKNLSQGQE